MESVTKAKGRWPLRVSGMETTQDSAIAGCEVMACSMEPGNRQIFSASSTRRKFLQKRAV